jgi:hypothetical protein
MTSYGVSEVSVPKTHKFGQLERPIEKLWLSNFVSGNLQDSFFATISIQSLSQDVYFKAIDKFLVSSKSSDIKIYVLSFNATFDDTSEPHESPHFHGTRKGLNLGVSALPDGESADEGVDAGGEGAIWICS